MKPIAPKFMKSRFAKDYRGYNQTHATKIDEEIARIGPGTPCGEFLRRYWHPVALTSEINDLPLDVPVVLP